MLLHTGPRLLKARHLALEALLQLQSFLELRIVLGTASNELKQERLLLLKRRRLLAELHLYGHALVDFRPDLSFSPPQA